MKRIMLMAVWLCGTLGCEKRPSSQEENAVAASRSLIAALATNASVRVIRGSAAVRANLKAITDKDERASLLAAWKEALKGIPVEGLRPSDRYWAVREAHHELDSNLIGAMWDEGCSCEARWTVRLDAIRWLDRQIVAMKPEKGTANASWREENEKWDNYQALAEYREVVIENIELNRLDRSRYPNDVEQMDEIRTAFEKLIGRPVRRNEDVRNLGFYRRQVGARIQKEREARFMTITQRPQSP